jgi:transposase
VKQLYDGIDWATRTHAVAVVDDQGGIRARFEVPNTGKGFGGLIRRLLKLQVAGVAIERPDGPLVEAMLDADLRVVVITPRQVKALRSRYGATGAKSDAADALLLADVLRTDRHRLQPLMADSDATIVLRALSRTRKDLQRPGWRCATSSPPSWSDASPARSDCSPTCTRPPRSPSCAAIPPARPPPP